MATATITPDHNLPCFTIDDDEDALNMLLDDETTGAIQLQESNPASAKSNQQLPEQNATQGYSLSSSPVDTAETPNHTPLSTSITSNNNTLLVHPPPSSTGANLGYHPEILDLKVKRKRNTAALGVVGGVAGLLLLGPIGGIAVGASAAICTKAAGKRKEKNKAREIRKQRALAQAMEEAELAAQQQQHHHALDLPEDDSTAVTATSEFTAEPNTTASS